MNIFHGMFWTGVWQAMPIVIGYVPIALTFGMVAAEMDITPGLATAISTFVFAGAAQFLLIAMYDDGMQWGLIVLLAGLINLRHAVYGAPLGRRLPATWWGTRAISAHALTDEVFALALGKLDGLPSDQRWPWFTGIALAAFTTWVGATAVGAFSASSLAAVHQAIPDTMTFALPALFVVLLMPHMKGDMAIAMAVAFGTAVAMTWSGLPNMGILIAGLAGIVTLRVIATCRATLST
jgi:4-azaleucine resistance transporter AzlC